eukprot:TRINITY_DN6866_c0_g1_i1.p1 TRINITY_DN6866_c0_g1~~TRINITY_DN6866_c0_g1_i1.p1  ORF type:complete len:355 (-),score=36.91 TRINITY_DN6866_c0_g1_i1:129-1193(-)
MTLGGTSFDSKREHGDHWQIVEAAAMAHLILRDVYPFPLDLLSQQGYRRKGYKNQNCSFSAGGGLLHLFTQYHPHPDNILWENHHHDHLYSFPSLLLRPHTPLGQVYSAILQHSLDSHPQLNVQECSLSSSIASMIESHPVLLHGLTKKGRRISQDTYPYMYTLLLCVREEVCVGERRWLQWMEEYLAHPLLLEHLPDKSRVSLVKEGHRMGLLWIVPQPWGYLIRIKPERVAMHLYAIPDIRLFWRDLHSMQRTPFKAMSVDPPGYVRDISFWIVDASLFSEERWRHHWRWASGDVLQHLSLHSLWSDDIRHSRCYRFTFRSVDIPLSKEDVSNLISRVMEQISPGLGILSRS